jgi:hypothetical protein
MSKVSRIGLTLLWLIAVAVPSLMVLPAKAEQTLPPIDLLVYLDNSKTIFTGAPDAPNKRLESMLQAVFGYRMDGGKRAFVTARDRVSFYTFGRKVAAVAESVDGGDTAALTSAVGRLSNAAEGDPITDFAELLKAITRNEMIRQRDDGRLT